jgi:AhpD family alkylhydroperoxidase
MTTRISPVPAEKASPFTRLGYWYSRRAYGEVPEPAEVLAHHPRILKGYGAFEFAIESSSKVPKRLKYLGIGKVAAMVGCEWCMDFGSELMRRIGLSERELSELPRYRDSDAFTPLEKLVIEYAEAMTRTPVEVSDELFDALREHFDEQQLVELTATLAIENLRARLNHSLGIGSQGFSEGAYCIRPERPAEAG